MINTCNNCKWSYLKWMQKNNDSFPTTHLRCNPGGDNEKDQVAEIPCLKFEQYDCEI